MTDDLISRARAGDGEAFRALTEPHRRELHVHCYRMLGSLQDAEDALQETMLAARRGLDGFGERASMRTCSTGSPRTPASTPSGRSAAGRPRPGTDRATRGR